MSICEDIHSSVVRLLVFSFMDNNLSKCQWIFTKLDVCIDIVEIWFGIVYGQISSVFQSYLPATCQYFDLQIINNFSKCQWIFTYLGVCIDIVEIWFGIADGQISSIF